MFQGRVSSVPRGEKNYHIFYQMLAGLTNDEKGECCLYQGHVDPECLYLNTNVV